MSDAWTALAGGAWDGPVRFEAAGATWAGAVRRLDVDEDAHVVGIHAQARLLGGWAGVAADISARPNGRGGYALDADATLSGTATDAAEKALLDAVRARIDATRYAGPAEDPAYRRKLAARAAVAVAVGVAAGLAGAAWDRRRRE